MFYVVVLAVTVWGFAVPSVTVFEVAVLSLIALDGTVYPVACATFGSSGLAN